MDAQTAKVILTEKIDSSIAWVKQTLYSELFKQGWEEGLDAFREDIDEALALLDAEAAQEELVERANEIRYIGPGKLSKEQIDIHIIRRYLENAPRKSLTDKNERLLAIASLDRLAARPQDEGLREALEKILYTDWAMKNGRYDVTYAEILDIARAALKDGDKPTEAVRLAQSPTPSGGEK